MSASKQPGETCWSRGLSVLEILKAFENPRTAWLMPFAMLGKTTIADTETHSYPPLTLLTDDQVAALQTAVPDFTLERKLWSKVEGVLIARCGMAPTQTRDMTIPQIVAVLEQICDSAADRGKTAGQSREASSADNSIPERDDERMERQIADEDARRPVDPDMLRTFCDAYERRVAAFSAMLQTIVQIATDQRDPDSWRRREAEVDAHVTEMSSKLPLSKQHMSAVYEFLTELRAATGRGPVRVGDVSHSTAHLVAAEVLGRATEGWESSKSIAQRSRTDRSYIYATSASSLFYHSHMKALPKPNDLMAELNLERAAAMKVLRHDQHRADVVRTANCVPESVEQEARTKRVGTSTRTSATDVAAQLERYRRAGGIYLDQRAFGRLCGCGPSTVNKAIKMSAGLRRWKDAAIEKRTPRATPRRESGDFDVVLDRVPIESHLPMSTDDVDATLNKLRREASGNPKWIEALNGLSPDEQEQIAQLYADGGYEPSSMDPRAPKPKHYGRV